VFLIVDSTESTCSVLVGLASGHCCDEISTTLTDDRKTMSCNLGP
jgi:hypothetical protein